MSPHSPTKAAVDHNLSGLEDFAPQPDVDRNNICAVCKESTEMEYPDWMVPLCSRCIQKTHLPAAPWTGEVCVCGALLTVTDLKSSYPGFCQECLNEEFKEWRNFLIAVEVTTPTPKDL